MSGVLIGLLLGAFLGSFLNVCIYRIPRNISLVNPSRSFCPNCLRQIPWYENVPIFGWFLLRGRCSQCGQPISFRYPVVELLTAGLYALCAAIVPFPTFLSLWIFFSLLIIATFVDLEFLVIPDVVSKSGIVAGIVLSLITPGLHHTVSRLGAVTQSVIGCVSGAALLLVIGFLGRLAFGRHRIEMIGSAPFRFAILSENDAQIVINEESFQWQEYLVRKQDKIVVRVKDATLNGKLYKDCVFTFFYDRLATPRLTLPLEEVTDLTGHAEWITLPREAMGLGDVKLIAAIGAFTGWQGVLFTIAAASLFGSIYGLGVAAARRREWSSKVPFGPFLALGSIVWVLGGREAVLQFFGVL
jgi:leader peptidase (prepilin peptidase) / N-methyltransferase